MGEITNMSNSSVHHIASVVAIFLAYHFETKQHPYTAIELCLLFPSASRAKSMAFLWIQWLSIYPHTDYTQGQYIIWYTIGLFL